MNPKAHDEIPSFFTGDSTNDIIKSLTMNKKTSIYQASAPVNEKQPEIIIKKKKVNFHHGNSDLYQVKYHFGTNKYFESYRDPHSPFDLLSFIIPRHFESNSGERTMSNKNEHEILFSRHTTLYQINHGEGLSKENYLEIGSGILNLKSINSEFILIFERPGKNPLQLQLIKGVNPKIRQEVSCQLCAIDKSSLAGYVYLTKFTNPEDAKKLFSIVSG